MRVFSLKSDLGRNRKGEKLNIQRNPAGRTSYNISILKAYISSTSKPQSI